MADKSAKRRVYIYIDGSQVANSVDAISKELRKVQNAQKQLVIGSDEYIRAGRKITQLNSILKQHSSNINQVGQSWLNMGKITDGFNRFFGIATSIIAAITGITFAVRKSVDEFAALEEKEADVRKYTGMTANQVKDLNEEFKKMDTRTSREQLNSLAADAGRLGIKGKKDILEFVEAANIINVSLGEDLGKDAIKNIGKLAQMFGTEGKSLKEGMLAVGSAINEVAQNSSAAEPYLVDFTARLSGTAKQAGISVSNILGFASVLDQDMQQVEMSATALQNLIMKVYQEPAKFAKMAGKDVKEFSALLKNDANEAILQLLTNLSKNGGLDKLSPLFKEMGLDGVRASGVLSTLAINIDKIRKEQETATKAYNEGSSAINEYSVKNNTLQASFEKAKKRFKEISYELGEKLSPYMGNLITLGGSMVKVLSALTGFVIKHSAALTSLAIVAGSYFAILKAINIYQVVSNSLIKVGTTLKILHAVAVANLSGNLTGANKILLLFNGSLSKNSLVVKACTALTYLYAAAKAVLTGNIQKATIAIKAFNSVVFKNPWVALAALIIGAGVSIYQFATKTSIAKEAVKEFIAESERERKELKKLTDAAKLAGDGTERRKILINEINSKYGKYLTNLLDEKSSLNDIKRAYAEINRQMDLNIAKKILDEKQEVISRKYLDEKVSEMGDIRKMLRETFPESMTQYITKQLADLTLKVVEGGMDVDKESLALSQKIKKIFYQGADVPAHLANQIRDYMNVVRNEYKEAKELENQMSAFVPGVANSNEVPEVVVTAEKIEKKQSSDNNDSEIETDKERKEKLQKELKAIDDRATILRTAAIAEYAAGISDLMTYENELYDIERNALEDKKKLYKDDSAEQAKIQEQIYKLEIDERKKFLEKYYDLSLEEMDRKFKEEKLYLEQKRTDDFMSEEAYYESMLRATIQYLTAKKALYKDDPEKADKVQTEIDSTTGEYQAGRATRFAKKKEQFLSEYASKSPEDMKNEELDALDLLYNEKKIKEDEYQLIRQGIIDKYDQLELQKKSDKFQKETELAQESLAMLQSLMSAYSEFISASQEAEEAQVNKKYDSEIKAAGKNTNKTKQLEEKKEKELAAIKSKYADKAFSMQIAMAIASTAQAAINAYASASQVNFILGPIAAGMAVAAGMIQIATIKKQHQAAKKGYFKGGYTASGKWDEEQGVVHSDEFVANRFATSNSTLRPVFDVIDYAQRTGTVASLTREDLAHALSIPGYYNGGYAPRSNDTSQSSATPSNDNILLFMGIIEQNTKVMERVHQRLNVPLEVVNTVDGEHGMKKAWDEYNSLINNKTRL